MDSWSTAPRETTRLHVAGAGRLGAAAPAEPLELPWTYDPAQPPPTLGGANLPPLPHGPRDHAALGARKDVLVFSTGPLKEALRLEGNASFTFTFRCDAPDCDCVAQLCDAPPGGGAFPLAEGAVRARLRNGRAEPLHPGEATRVTLRFRATAADIAAGHELRLYLASGGWPRYARNPHTGEDQWNGKEAKPLHVTLVVDEQNPALLELPRLAP